MSIAFTAGATGYTGRHVAHYCAQRGLTSYAHVRPNSPQLPRWQQEFGKGGVLVDTTPWEPGRLAAQLQALKPIYVFALLGTTQAGAKKHGLTDPYEQIDFGLTVMLTDAALAVTPMPRLIYLSSMGASGKGPGAYLKARGKTENYIRQSGLPFTIARPSFISGPDRDEKRPAERFAARLTGGAAGLMHLFGATHLAARLQPITGAQLARVLVTLAGDPSMQGQVVEADGLQAINTRLRP